jgi:hypothetical protein
VPKELIDEKALDAPIAVYIRRRVQKEQDDLVLF